MGPEGSLPHLHVLSTCPYPEPARSSCLDHTAASAQSEGFCVNIA